MSAAENKAIVRCWVKPLALLVATSVVVIVLGSLLASGSAQNQPQSSRATEMADFPEVIRGLKATPGVLGIETAKTGSGKEVIFAWFEDKQAVLRWYYSDIHQEVQKRHFPNVKYREPLKGVPDDGRPIMAIVSITLADKPPSAETPLPISQIAIELYQPLTGGLFLGGRFAPESLKVPEMRDYTPKK